jgi:hypothetical protein
MGGHEESVGGEYIVRGEGNKPGIRVPAPGRAPEPDDDCEEGEEGFPN